jgi:uncharacterized membrane protein
LTFIGACILGSLVLAIVMSLLAFVSLAAAFAEASLYDRHDFRRAIWEEREALRIVRARYARGLVSAEEFRRLRYELEAGHPA